MECGPGKSCWESEDFTQGRGALVDMGVWNTEQGPRNGVQAGHWDTHCAGQGSYTQAPGWSQLDTRWLQGREVDGTLELGLLPEASESH